MRPNWRHWVSYTEGVDFVDPETGRIVDFAAPHEAATDYVLMPARADLYDRGSKQVVGTMELNDAQIQSLHQTPEAVLNEIAGEAYCRRTVHGVIGPRFEKGIAFYTIEV